MNSMELNDMDRAGCRLIALGLAVFWLAVIGLGVWWLL